MESTQPGAMARAVVVTGPPASGKSTLGRAVAEILPGRFVSLDQIKEHLFEESRGALMGWPLRQAAEAELMDELALAVAAGQVPVVDIWVQPGRDDARVATLLNRAAGQVVEVMCAVPADVAVSRFFARDRGGPHDNAQAGLAEQIRVAVAEQQPLGVGPHLVVETTGPVDLDGLASQIRALLA